ncbi:hypothetical protein PIB30_082734, partial [Stylosanthes scabra]|nr:hypothetical protein [Stylosanthes scabra]
KYKAIMHGNRMRRHKAGRLGISAPRQQRSMPRRPYKAPRRWLQVGHTPNIKHKGLVWASFLK